MHNSFGPISFITVLHCFSARIMMFTAVVVGFTNPVFAETYYDKIKTVVFSDPYENLPQYQVKRSLFDQDGQNILLEDARRTLRSQSDLIEFPAGQKLLQANGICFAGEWRMDKDSPFSGLYAANTTLPILVRASVSLSGTRQKDKRAFAIAVKLFPKQTNTDTVTTRNLFLMHSLGGIKTRHVLDLHMDNEPELGALPPISQWLTASRLESDLEEADRLISGDKANARFRPVSHLVYLDSDGKKIIDVTAPFWVRASAPDLIPRVDKEDFRDELQVRNYPEQTLIWELHAAEYHPNGKSESDWRYIGKLVLTESVVSKSCDTALHFTHPTLD